MRRAAALPFAALVGLALGAAVPALAQDPPDPPPDPAPSAATEPDAGQTWASCVEHVPPGATRPVLVERFPERGFSGYAQALTITVTHGKGESVLPEGFKVQRGSDAARAIEASDFVIPEADGGSPFSITTEAGEASSTTTVTIPFVALPEKPGRALMVLPPVPIAIARASGEVVTLCTRTHPILIEDPIANELDPKVKPNPEPRPQREEWVLAQQLALGVLGGVVVGVLLGFLIRRWVRRPKPVFVPPPKLPWVAALEELDAIRRSKLIEEKKTDEYFDRVSDAVRRYLGARYGFDGLESTTDEMRALLKRVRPKVGELKRIGAFLEDCDLVKFARMVPTGADCLAALATGEEIVRHTTPRAAETDEVLAAEGGDLS